MSGCDGGAAALDAAAKPHAKLRGVWIVCFALWWPLAVYAIAAGGPGWLIALALAAIPAGRGAWLLGVWLADAKLSLRLGRWTIAWGSEAAEAEGCGPHDGAPELRRRTGTGRRHRQPAELR